MKKIFLFLFIILLLNSCTEENKNDIEKRDAASMEVQEDVYDWIPIMKKSELIKEYGPVIWENEGEKVILRKSSEIISLINTKAENIINNIISQNYENLAQYVHPTFGITFLDCYFVPDNYLKDRIDLFSRDQIKTFASDTKKYDWRGWYYFHEIKKKTGKTNSNFMGTKSEFFSNFKLSSETFKVGKKHFLDVKGLIPKTGSINDNFIGYLGSIHLPIVFYDGIYFSLEWRENGVQYFYDLIFMEYNGEWYLTCIHKTNSDII